MSQDDTALAKRIQSAFDAASLTHAAVAARLGVGRTTVTHWCSGRCEPSVEDLGRLAEIAGVSPMWLAWGQGEMRASTAETLDVAPAPTLPAPGEVAA